MGISLFGCADASYTINYDYRFNVGTRVWLDFKARKGILESVVIKRIKVNSTKNNFFLYVDTNNAYYNEDELITYDDALDLVEDYEAMQAAAALDARRRC